MQAADSRPFLERLVALAELLESATAPPMSIAKQKLYFDALKDLPFTEVVAALSAAAKGCTFMPKPAELRKLVLGDVDDHAEAAWLLFRKAMRQVGAYTSIATSDPALGETVTAMFGGWAEACAADFSPEMWSSKRKEFGRIYRLLRDRALTGARYLPGLTEIANGRRDDWKKYIPLAVLDGAAVRQLEGPAADAYRAQLATGAAGSPTSLKQIADVLPGRRKGMA